MAVQPGLCGTRSETPKTGFLITRVNSSSKKDMMHTKGRLYQSKFRTKLIKEDRSENFICLSENLINQNV